MFLLPFVRSFFCIPIYLLSAAVLKSVLSIEIEVSADHALSLYTMSVYYDLYGPFIISTLFLSPSLKSILISVNRLGDFLDFGQLFKAFSNNNLPKSLTFLGIFCKGVKMYHFSSEIIFGQLWQFFSGHTGCERSDGFFT